MKLSRPLTITLVVVLLLFLLVTTYARQHTSELDAAAQPPSPMASEYLMNVGDSLLVYGSDCAPQSSDVPKGVKVTCAAFPPGVTPVPVFVATPAGTP